MTRSVTGSVWTSFNTAKASFAPASSVTLTLTTTVPRCAVTRNFSRSRRSNSSGLVSIPLPYMTPGTFPWNRRFRFFSLPVLTRRAAASSIMAISSLLLNEQRAYGILEVDSLDGFPEESRHRQDPKLPARRLGSQRNRVRDHQLLDRGLLEPLDRRPREHPVRGRGEHPLGPFFPQRLGRMDQRPRGVHHVIEQDRRPAFHRADDIHHLHAHARWRAT